MALVKCSECGEAISNKATQCPKCGAPQPKKTSLTTWLALVLVGLIVVGYMSAGPTDAPRTTSAPAGPSASQLERQNVKFNYQWVKAGFDNVMMINFTITNENPHAIKDAAIACTMYSKSGTGLGTNRKTLFEVVPPGGQLTRKEFNMGLINNQADSASCRIYNVETAN